MVNGHRAAAAAGAQEELWEAVSPTWSEQVYRDRIREALQENWARGFCQMPDAVRHDRALSPKAKIIYEQLLFHMRFGAQRCERDHCWPSQQTLADATGYSRRTVIRACKELYERGYIEKWRPGQGHTNYYFINPLTFPRSFRRTERELVETMILDVHAPELRQDIASCTPRTIDEAFSQCQPVTSRSDNVSQPEAPECHPKQTKSNDIHEKENSSNVSTLAQKGTVFPVAVMTTRNEQQQARKTDAESVGAENDVESGTKEAELHQFPSKSNNSSTSSPPQAIPEHAKDAMVNNILNNQTKQAAIAVATGIPEAHLAEMGIAEDPAKRSIPEFLKDIITRYSRELGDNDSSTKSNITRAAKLYYFAHDYIRDAQDDPQGFFSELLYEAKQAAYKVNGIRYRSASNRPNRIPVFFTCLENRFELSDEEREYIRSDAPLLEPYRELQ